MPTTDPAAAQACVAWLKTASCDVFTTGSCSGSGCDAGTAASPCVGLLAGIFTSTSGVGQGQSCESDSCTQGLYCAPSVLVPDAGVRTCRVCQPPSGIGAACSYDGVPCVTGAWCQTDVDGGSACTAQGAAGAACQSPQECLSGFCNYPKGVCDDGGHPGDPCAAASDCRQGYCDAGGQCAEYKAAGDPCTADAECTNQHCDPSNNLCGLPDGATCDSYNDTECQSGNCDDTSRTCVPKLADGSPCVSSAECESSYCNFSTQTCTERCSTDADCGDGRWCNWSTNTCEDKKADGAACQDANECLNGYCNSEEKCAIQPKVGDPCTGYGDCPLEAFCNAGTTCQERKGPGDSCPSLDSCMAPFFCINGHCELMSLQCKPAKAGQMCAYLRVCDDESYCDLLDNTVCKARSGAGESCMSSDTCQADLYCAPGGSSGMECEPRQAAGETCTTAAECQADLFCAAIGSGTTMTCTAGPAGQPCNGGCPDGFYCATSDVCAPLKTLGEQCNSSFEPCTPELYCDTIAGCKERPGLGESCDYNTPCAAGFYCDTSGSPPYSCVARADLGAQCSTSTTYGVQCLEQYRCDYDTTLGQDVCMAKKGLGDSCTFAADCASGICSQMVCLATDQCVMP